MNSTTPSAAAERPARHIYPSSASDCTITRMYKFTEHHMELHTHIGRYETIRSRPRRDWVAIVVSDLIFTDISRHQAAIALWGYRHDPSLTITELRGAN